MAYRESWEEAVRQAISATGRSVRSLAPKVGCTASYIGAWQLGQVPNETLVRSFARVTGADEEKMLRAAGYLPPWNADDAFMDGVRCAREEKGAPIMVSTEEMPLDDATEEDVLRALIAIRKRENLSPDCPCLSGYSP